MHLVAMIAVSHFDLRWGFKFLIVGALFTALGGIGWYLIRKKSPEERSRYRNSLGGERGYMFLFLGLALIVIGIGLLVVGLF